MNKQTRRKTFALP